MNFLIKKINFFSEMLIPWQSLSSYFWLFSGMLCSPDFEWGIVTKPLFLFVLIAIFAARSAGMLLNRIIDRHIDSENCRTKNRMLPSKRASLLQSIFYTLLFFGIFWMVTFFCPFSGQIVGLWVTFLIMMYSYTKRFTYFCHFILGLIHGTLPIVGSICATSAVSFSSILLGVAAFFAISGTDILYAIADEAFDKKARLYSIPACFSVSFAIKSAFILHLVSMITISFCMGMNLFFSIWIFFCGYGLFLWKTLFQDREQIPHLFSQFFIIFSGGTFFSLFVRKVWIALL